ncbi:hypothetical protein U9M48_027590, partial [Paspalum notatum var. saurae]
MKGFSPLLCQWIQQFVSKGSVAVKVNNDVGYYFQTNKGLCQEDPLSPILFDLVVDMLPILITRAKKHGQIRGLIPHLVDEGLSILQYANDTILFMEHGLEQAKHRKLILRAFDKLSGLKINFHKSELFCYGQPKDFVEQYSQIFGCEDHFQKKLSGWKGKLLSYGGHLVLVSSVLSNLAMFMMSFYVFEVPKDIIKKLDFYRSIFFWQGDNYKKKGLGIRNLEIHNICLLSKWLSTLINEDGVWQTIIKNYLRGQRTILELSTFNLHERSQIRFWEDRWFCNYPLKDLYLLLYNITRKRHITVAIVWDRLRNDPSDSIKRNVSKLGLFT